jgi:hypothetical protein
MPKQLPSIELLRKLLRYEPETGKLFWLERPPSMFPDGKQPAKHNAAIWNGKHAGKEAFTANCGQGYRAGALFSVKVRAHRVAWAMHYGEWSKETIDHINGNRSDNRICNLRHVTIGENNKSLAMRVGNKSGVTGVSWCKRDNRWYACINDNGASKFLGRFDSFEDAVSARVAAAKELGYSERHGERI